jgi:hypothetical protein
VYKNDFIRSCGKKNPLRRRFKTIQPYLISMNHTLFIAAVALLCLIEPVAAGGECQFVRRGVR